MLQKDQAICIRTVDYSDTSQVATFFCREAGKVAAIAKGSRRPKSAFGGAIEMFSRGQIVYSSRGDESLATLTEFERQGDYVMLRRRMQSLNSALFAAELVNSLTTDHDPHADVYDGLEEFLAALEGASDKCDALRLLVVFQLGLLSSVGMGLVLGRCANCKAPNRDWPAAYFSSSANGLLCRDCESSFHDRIAISPASAKRLGELSLLHEADEGALEDIEKAVIHHLTAILHRPPRMAGYFIGR